MLSLETLIHAQVVVRSVTCICAFVGLSFAFYDWRMFRNRTGPDAMVPYASTIPSFVLICFVAIFYTPVTFSNITDFELSGVQAGWLRLAALSLLLVYFFVISVKRLLAYKLPKSEAIRKSASIFTGMVLLTAVGFYG